jgi:hypothetical protein
MSCTSAHPLDEVAAELRGRGHEPNWFAPEGHEPWLAVRNPKVPMLAETVLVHDRWFGWLRRDRIDPAADVPTAADRALTVLTATSGEGA